MMGDVEHGVVTGMFKLTKQEQMIIAFLAGAIVLGSIVREWRAWQATKVPAAAADMKD